MSKTENVTKTETTAGTQQGTQNRDPWAAQVPYLTDAFQQAQSLYNNPTSTTPISQQQAQFTPEQLATFQGMYGYANGNTTPQSTAAAGANLTNAGQGYLASGASGVQSAANALAGTQSMSPQNIAWMNQRAANQYADGQDISGQTTAAMRDATRAVNEQALPSIARDAAVNGNTFSNRRALQEGVVQRGLAEKTADVSSNLRANAYNTGLGLAEQSRQFDNSQRQSALQSGGALSQALAGMGLNTTGAGLGANNSALGQQAGLFQLANAGAAGGQANSQIGLDNAYSKAAAAQGTPWQNLMNYLQVVGGQQWGGTTTSNQTITGNTSGNTEKKTTPGLYDYLALGVDAFGKAAKGGGGGGG